MHLLVRFQIQSTEGNKTVISEEVLGHARVFLLGKNRGEGRESKLLKTKKARQLECMFRHD